MVSLYVILHKFFIRLPALVIAMQFYHLVKVLLALHNPHPMRGIEFLHFARAVEVMAPSKQYVYNSFC